MTSPSPRTRPTWECDWCEESNADGGGDSDDDGDSGGDGVVVAVTAPKLGSLPFSGPVTYRW